MIWWQNLPLPLILLPLVCAAVSSVLKARAARALTAVLIALECAGMGALLYFTLQNGGQRFTVAMGDIGAPFGNELRIGPLEALVGLLFSLIMLLSILGGWDKLKTEIAENRAPYYGVMICLLCAAMTAMTFTNDLFTAYVFIEISTIAACALIAASNQGHALFASIRYMIMNLLGSGLFLLGLSMLYCLTGHLLFPQLGESVKALLSSGDYPVPLSLSFLLMTFGIAIKSALYPFHTWVPSAYGSATASSSAILSSIISKMYIFLLIKVFLRAAGEKVFTQPIRDVLFVYAVLGMILGSVDAVRERKLNRMVAYSSVAQIGYIFLGIAMGTPSGFSAAVFYMAAHSFAKSMLFLSANQLKAASGGEDSFRAIRGAALRCPLAGAAFLVGACSLVGIPPLGGFAGKVFLASAGASLGSWRMAVALAALAAGTALNALYFFRAGLNLFRPPEPGQEKTAPVPAKSGFTYAMIVLIALNLLIGVFGGGVMEWIEKGFQLFVG